MAKLLDDKWICTTKIELCCQRHGCDFGKLPNGGIPQVKIHWIKWWPWFDKFYSSGCRKMMDLASVLPAFQVEFGHTATLLIVNAKICGFSDKVLVLTDSTMRNQVVYKALLRNFHLVVEVNSTFPHLELVTEFDASQFVAEFDVMSTNSLQQLACRTSCSY